MRVRTATAAAAATEGEGTAAGRVGNDGATSAATDSTDEAIHATAGTPPQNAVTATDASVVLSEEHRAARARDEHRPGSGSGLPVNQA